MSSNKTAEQIVAAAMSGGNRAYSTHDVQVCAVVHALRAAGLLVSPPTGDEREALIELFARTPGDEPGPLDEGTASHRSWSEYMTDAVLAAGFRLAGRAPDLEVLDHDEGTMQKVWGALKRAGLRSPEMTDAVTDMQNAGIFFRERAVATSVAAVEPPKATDHMAERSWMEFSNALIPEHYVVGFHRGWRAALKAAAKTGEGS